MATVGGAVAQLGECLTGSQEVGGSNPLSSTIPFLIVASKVNNLAKVVQFFFQTWEEAILSI